MEQKPSGTRDALLKTALNLIWTQSYGGVSVDDICRASKAKKGSFYHYFESKAALVSAALEAMWGELRPSLDKFFSTQNAPLERLRMYLDAGLEEQLAMKKAYGHVVGCPFTSIASEQCACDDGLQEKAKEILGRFERYLAGALRDAVSEGSLPPMNADEMARRFLTYEVGALSFAKVRSDLKPVEDIFETWMRMAGMPEERLAAERAAHS